MTKRQALVAASAPTSHRANGHSALPPFGGLNVIGTFASAAPRSKPPLDKGAFSYVIEFSVTSAGQSFH